MSTDSDWQAWGIRDPYFAVLTHPRFRAAAMTPQARRDFFYSGEIGVKRVFEGCNRVNPDFAPRRILDFGCGVGRMVIAFARRAPEVIGMDIATSMLEQARLNCAEHGVENVSLVVSDDALTAATDQFDLVHSCIVLQHVELPRGRNLFAALVAKVKPGGCGAIQLPFACELYQSSFGVAPAVEPKPAPSRLKSRLTEFIQSLRSSLSAAGRSTRAAEPTADPEMQMNYYNLSELMFILHSSGIQQTWLEFTNHGGALGVFMYFRKPGS